MHRGWCSFQSVLNFFYKHRKNCECCPRHSLFKGHNVIVIIVVLDNLKQFQNSENFPKIWKFSENMKIFRKSKFFSKIWKFSKNVWLLLVTCVKGHKSLRVLFGSVFSKVSEWVTREPIELSGAVRKGFSIWISYCKKTYLDRIFYLN